MDEQTEMELGQEAQNINHENQREQMLAEAEESIKQLQAKIEQRQNCIRELKASDNWLHRLLKSCVIFLDDGEVTKRAVEKQSRYNRRAIIKAEELTERKPAG